MSTSTKSRAAPSNSGMDPRIKARRVAVKRQMGKKRLRLSLAGAVAVGVVAGAVAVLHSPLLSARHLSVRGEIHTSKALILEAAGLESHPPLVDVSPASALAVERLPWILTARVQEHWPDSVVVEVTERVPVALLSTGPHSSLLVDRTGRVLGPAVSTSGLVGLKTPDHPGAPGSRLGPLSRSGLLVISSLPKALAGRVVAVSVGRNGLITLDLGGALSAFLGSADALAPKFESLAAVLAGASPVGPAMVDVSQPGEPTVTPLAPSSAASGTTGSQQNLQALTQGASG